MNLTEHLKNTWEEEDLSDFYSQLRNFSKTEQSTLVLLQAAKLSNLANHKDEYLLKGAESLVNFWILQYSNSEEKEQADFLLNNIQESLENLRG